MTGKAILPCSATTLTSLSEVPLPDGCVVVFDLDDTLYPERNFVRSGFEAISRYVENQCGDPVFRPLWSLFTQRHHDPLGEVIAKFQLPCSKTELLDIYRNHAPNVTLTEAVCSLLCDLRRLGHPLGLLTDGRSITQRNKIQSLGLGRWLDDIVISEEFGSSKPSVENFEYFERRFPSCRCAYVGDNLTKDFVAPNELGWLTVCVRDQGRNIHSQDATGVDEDALPNCWIERLA